MNFLTFLICFDCFDSNHFLLKNYFANKNITWVGTKKRALMNMETQTNKVKRKVSLVKPNSFLLTTIMKYSVESTIKKYILLVLNKWNLKKPSSYKTLVSQVSGYLNLFKSFLHFLSHNAVIHLYLKNVYTLKCISKKNVLVIFFVSQIKQTNTK